MLLALNLFIGNISSVSDAAHPGMAVEKDNVFAKKIKLIGKYQFGTWATDKEHGYYIIDTVTWKIVSEAG